MDVEEKAYRDGFEAGLNEMAMRATSNEPAQDTGVDEYWKEYQDQEAKDDS